MSFSKYFAGKVVLITGGSMGIGKELAKQILTHGGQVAITARNQSRLDAVLLEFGKHADNLMIHAGDAANYQDNVSLVEKVKQRFGKLDILINNAGMSCYGEVETLQPHVAEQVININIYGSLYPAMAAIQELKKSKGSILFVSSIAGFHGIPGYSMYSLSKMALTGLAQSMRTELRTSNVFVGIAYVGFTENEAEKKTISPQGALEKVPARPKHLTASRETTASILLQQVMERKHSVSHSMLGTFTHILSRYFPSALTYFLARNYHKQINSG